MNKRKFGRKVSLLLAFMMLSTHISGYASINTRDFTYLGEAAGGGNQDDRPEEYLEETIDLEDSEVETTDESEIENGTDLEEKVTEEAQEEDTRENQEENTGESQEENTGESQEENIEESQEENAGESQEESAGESQEENTGEVQEETTADSKEDITEEVEDNIEENIEEELSDSTDNDSVEDSKNKYQDETELKDSLSFQPELLTIENIFVRRDGQVQVELQWNGDEDMDLDGRFYLTDTETDLKKFSLEKISLAPGQFYRVTLPEDFVSSSEETSCIYLAWINEEESSIIDSYFFTNQFDAENGFAQSKNITVVRKEFIITDRNDDAELEGKSVNMVSTGLDFHGKKDMTVFVRFPNIQLPEDANVVNAYLSFDMRNTSRGDGEIVIDGEKGNGEAFQKTAESFESRIFTDQSLCMTAPVLKSGTRFETDNMADVINEMIESDQAVNDFVFRIKGTDTGSFIAVSRDGSSSRAPVLVIEYTTEVIELISEITVKNNDAEERGTNNTMVLDGLMAIGGYYSSSMSASSKQRSAFRFEDIEIPDDAEIEDAYIEFTVYGVANINNISNMAVQMEMGEPAIYTSEKNNISNRIYYRDAVTYQQTGFVKRKDIVKTANLKSIIDQHRLMGWQSGQPMAFKIEGDSYLGTVYQGGSSYSPRLIIRYRDNGNGPSGSDEGHNPDLINGVFINEVSAEGTKSSKEGWAEFYNSNDYPVKLDEGIFLYKDKDKKKSMEFSGFVIPANGYKIMYFDKKPENGSDHASFDLKSKAELILENSEGRVIDSFKYQSHSYNQTYGRETDGDSQVVLFIEESFGKSNKEGQIKYDLEVSHDRGVYDSGFELYLTPQPDDLQIRYTTDGTEPSKTKGIIFDTRIAVDKSCIVKLYGWNETGNTGVIPYTYVLKDNLRNEVVSGTQWRFKNNISDSEYAEAIAEFPIVSVAGDKSTLSRSDYSYSTFEYIASHIDGEGENFVGTAGAKKYGQVSSYQFNAGISIRFKRDFNTKAVKFEFFEPVEGDLYPVVKKFGKLKLKEGQDGPQDDIYNLGYNRYDEMVTNTLAKMMGKLAVSTKYVHYFYNGKYMGIKTLKEDFDPKMFEAYFGDDSDNYTKMSFQDGTFATGIVEAGDGDSAILKKIKAVATSKDLQQFKQYVDVEDMIQNQILYMFIDTEREINGVVHNDVLENGIKARFNINDTDGAFFNNGKTGTGSYAVAGGGGNYRYKWIDSISRNGAGKMFGYFSGDSTDPTKGNLEFKTLVKDQVLKQIGSEGAPLSVDNVKQVLLDSQDKLAVAYRLDAAFMGARTGIYSDWLKCNDQALNQVPDRVSYSLEMWKKYNMAHTLEPVEIQSVGDGYVLINSNQGDIYFTTDGSDPMGADGVISDNAQKYETDMVISDYAELVVRPFTTNNWGPLTERGTLSGKE